MKEPLQGHPWPWSFGGGCLCLPILEEAAYGFWRDLAIMRNSGPFWRICIIYLLVTCHQNLALPVFQNRSGVDAMGMKNHQNCNIHALRLPMDAIGPASSWARPYKVPSVHISHPCHQESRVPVFQNRLVLTQWVRNTTKTDVSMQPGCLWMQQDRHRLGHDHIRSQAPT